MRTSVGSSRRFAVAFVAVAAFVGTSAASCTPEEIAAAKKYCAAHPCPPKTTTTNATTTTSATTTTVPATTTSTVTTTTTPTAGAFLSYPRQSGRQSFSGSNVVVSNRSYVGFTSGACLTVSNATNVWIHDVDFDGCGGAVFLINVTGTVTVERVRARNTGNGSIGSGQGNVVQFNNVWSSAGVVRDVKAYGGDTEDVISVFQSGGTDATHPLVLTDIHVEHPLSGLLAWSSGSGTCANLADAGGHDIRLQNSTFLNCGAVGIQMNEPDARVVATGNTVYGAARPTSNVGLSQWSSGDCPSTCPGNAYTNNRVNWKKDNGSQSDIWLSGNYPVSLSGNITNAAIDPATLRVVL